jgi:hypothetical protein
MFKILKSRNQAGFFFSSITKCFAIDNYSKNMPVLFQKQVFILNYDSICVQTSGKM